MSSGEITIHWFRRDLRVGDNPALVKAARHGQVLPVFILDETIPKDYALGSASKLWLFHSLKQLDQELAGALRCFRGNPQNILKQLAKINKIIGITWNRAYEPWRMAQDTKIKSYLQEIGLNVESFNGSLLWEPWENLKPDGSPYRVFTPFYRKGCLNSAPPRAPEKMIPIKWFPKKNPAENSVNDLNLTNAKHWEDEIIKGWNIGEKGAKKQLEKFLKGGIHDYKTGRNFPLKDNVSKLSPFLHWGQISVNEVWYAAQKLREQQPGLGDNVDHFLSELGWREFSHSLLYHFPKLPKSNLQSRFDNFPWERNDKALEAWQTGKTGIPIVDAGMRQLWKTGYMHNRLRMIVGSFLVKNLQIHWHFGQAWFWDTLFDADLANNSAGWQWIAGCGADAAPYFRIFNPVLQGLKFDPTGNFIRQFVPELCELPTKYIFEPWEAPTEVLENAKITLGDNYPYSLVNLKTSREKALTAFSTLKL